jgi:hypothetical protein
MMTDFIDDVMGFNPTDLNVFNAPEATDFNQNVYKTNPKDSKAEDGHYRSKLRVIYNPNDIKQSIVKQTTYAMNDADGFFMVKSKLANGDRECPIFKSWKKLWFSGVEEKKEWARKMYDKSESQWCLVQILEDDNRPELVGQIKAMKLPKAIFVKLEALMNPAPETKKTPVPVIDYIFGRVLEMDVTPGPDDPQHPERKQREIKYDLCAFESDPTPVIRVDGTPFFTDDELELIDTYNTARVDLAKAKSDKKKQEAQQVLADNQNAVRELYKNVIEYLKDNAIDLVKECAYQPWDEATEKRVQNWIDIVATMNDPKAVTSADVTTEPEVVAEPVPAAADDFMGLGMESTPF